MRHFYITTPIYYVNASPHLGHAYTTIVGDAACRLRKMLGWETLFLTGTDEHGDKIVQSAEKQNLSPVEFVEKISHQFGALWPKMSVALDFFTRTTDKRHIAAVQDFLRRVYDAGDIYFGEFGGYYCFGCERFYTEKELENGLCPQHLTKPQFINEKNYFFRMSRYLPWLKEYMENNPDLIRPERYRREAMAMVESGELDDLCISRPKSRLEWGIELPFDKNYVCYVWFDALVSYISGIGWPDGDAFRKFWPGEHLIAKDILKPHAIFWPCMLKSVGLPVYQHLDVHGYWLSRDTKMSKSLGNVVEPLSMTERFGLDAFRYFLLREMHFGSDANFGEDALIARINADLANDLGNLFSRVLSMAAKYLDSRTPAGHGFNPADEAIITLCRDSMANFIMLFTNMEFARALESLWQFCRALNKYVDSEAPWTLNKNGDLERLATVMGVLLASMRKIAISLWPVMPDAAQTMLAQLGEPVRSGAIEPPTRDLEAESNEFSLLEPGRKLASSSNLFPRIEIKKGEAGKEVANDGKKKEKPRDMPKNGYISMDAFKAVDIRVGEIIRAEKVANADRILLLEIDFGEPETRQILSGIAASYNPEELPGKKVCAILNLEPRKIRGLYSRGMVLTTGDGEAVRLLEPAATVEKGARVG